MSAQLRFKQAHLKREWANIHINSLHSQWKAFLQTDFCRVLVKDRPDGLQSIRVIADPLPLGMVMMVGDAVHNLRAALDYAISEILVHKNSRITFPMHKSREELEASFRTETEIVDGRTRKAGGNAALEIAAPGIGIFICDVIKPYEGSGGLLWTLGKLDNIDKHRLLITIVAPRTIEIIKASDNNGNFANRTHITINDSGYADVAMFSGGNFQINEYGKPSAEVLLNEAGVIEGQSLFPTLIQMSKAVDETLRSLDEFLSVRKA